MTGQLTSVSLLRPGVSQALQAWGIWIGGFPIGGPYFFLRNEQMTPIEFKAWFRGFTEALEGYPPNKEQWERIRAEVEKIGEPVIKDTISALGGPYQTYSTARGMETD